ncbi:hypothetical protein [Mycobacterium sp. NAZ190054]|uniref:hypothetical protein n=1 Tax=Mycobacterium sp. NAZ190054 TaxID=1747766 RepID=UPI000ABF074C|nr:hypothetical protein [Mycobacterium sp. NAZ190054]
MTTTTTAPPLPTDVEALMRGLRLSHPRAIAATAGRPRSMLAARRKAAGSRGWWRPSVPQFLIATTNTARVLFVATNSTQIPMLRPTAAKSSGFRPDVPLETV